MATKKSEPIQLTKRQEILREAEFITHNDRNKNYGNPEDNFQWIANAWNNHLAVSGREANITSADVAVFMIHVKLARLANNLNHRDSVVDVAGYAACLSDCQH